MLIPSGMILNLSGPHGAACRIWYELTARAHRLVIDYCCDDDLGLSCWR